MLQEYNLLINGVTLLISLSGLICEAQSPTNEIFRFVIDFSLWRRKMNDKRSGHLIIQAAGAAWKLENEDTFRMNMDSYMGVNKTIVPNFCMTMLQQSSARNWDKNIQNNIAYGCEVLKKYSELKWGARKKLDLMTIQWLVGSDKNSQSRYITDRGFDYCLKEKALQCSEDVMKIHRAKAEVNCISTTREYLELQRVKDTPNSKTQAIQFDKINENFNSSLIELKRRVENLEINRINYLKFMNPMERVISVIDAMEEEVDHKYGFYM
ncbi:hypothetical protein Smp_150240 [Schistosoma mansoni]|uniref:hypothetical protein n=1 Tax=Schistosoma mansoni TaxID=6183 RepID=UPI00022DC770|nr:hypothetical protein Smp_150240 [Schistosoma mansoni]|eukprot:XP_018651122.1 hypothetical protein Smp_150240 [Schistosoma mansoni]